MTGDCRVRFWESGGLGCPLPLDPKHHKHYKRGGKK